MSEAATAMETTETPATNTAQNPATGDTPGASSIEAAAQLGKEDGTGGEKPPVPFASGKEKFQVNGEEHEWDWPTVKKYAQIGRAGHAAMEKAANLEKATRETWAQIQTAGKSRPLALLETITGLGRAQIQQLIQQELGSAALSGGSGGNQQQQAGNPEVDALKEEVARVRGTLEQYEVEKARQQIETEIDTAVKEYPELNTPIHRQYVKSVYRDYLSRGVEDVSIADVAFHVSQQVKEMQAKQEQARAKARAGAKDKAPISSVPAQPAKGDQAMSREDVLKLAGRL